MENKKYFTKGEEIFNAVTHIVGAAFAIAGTVVLIVLAALSNMQYAVLSTVIYGVSMIIMFVMSSIYHFLRFNQAKKVFRIFDHCSIFLLIAGTYTPFCVLTLKDSVWGIILLCLVWFFAILGIIFNAIDMHNKYVQIFSQICYIVMGWSVIMAIVPILQVLSFHKFFWLLAGGICYTVGVIFYALGKKIKYFHSIWHLFVLMGCIFQFVSIVLILI